MKTKNPFKNKKNIVQTKTTLEDCKKPINSKDAKVKYSKLRMLEYLGLG